MFINGRTELRGSVGLSDEDVSLDSARLCVSADWLVWGFKDIDARGYFNELNC